MPVPTIQDLKRPCSSKPKSVLEIVNPLKLAVSGMEFILLRKIGKSMPDHAKYFTLLDSFYTYMSLTSLKTVQSREIKKTLDKYPET